MFIFIGIIGLLGFFVFLARSLVSVFRKNGKAKKHLLWAVILLVVAIIGIANAPASETEETTEAKAEKESKADKEEVKKEIPPSTVSDIKAAIKVDMTEKEYKTAKEKLNVEYPDSLSMGNGHVGRVLEAKDGFVVAGTDGKKILSVESFDSLDQAKKYAKDMYAKAEKEKAAAKAKAYEDAKIKLSGSGDTATDMMDLKAGFIVLDATYSGGSNFAVKLQSESGQDLELMVNEIGSYKGKTFAEIPADGKYYLNVTASGSWDFDISQQAPLEVEDVPGSFSGSGDDVLFFQAKKANYKFSFTHTGSSNFAVLLNGSTLMVNEIGAYNGSMRQNLTTDGTYLLVINADGQWTAKIEK